MPVDPNQISQDPDFQAAAPADQIKYLSHVDPDFAKASPQDQMGYISHITGKPAGVSNPDPSTLGPGLPKPPNPIPLAPQEGFGESLLNAASPAGASGGISDIYKGPAQAVQHPIDSLKLLAGAQNSTSLNELQQAKDAYAKGDYSRAALHALGYGVPFVGPLVAKAGEQADAHNFSGAAGTVAGTVGPALIGSDVHAPIKSGVSSLYDRAFPKPAADITTAKYSPQGDAIAASMRPNVKVDVPAEAHAAYPAIQEGLADRGYSTNDFQGRNGPKVLQSGIDNAMTLQEARAKQMIDPIRNEPVDPKILADNPELKARFGDKTDLTYGDLDNERVKMNKELKRANYYSKDPTAQNAAGDTLDNTQEAVNQARDLVYGKVADVTGADVRPIKQTESSLLKLTDLSNSTANSLSAREAKFQATPGYKKLIQSAKKVASVKSSPISAFSAYETPGLTSPLNEFNSNMQKAFPRLKPSKASFNGHLTEGASAYLPKYDLKLTSPEGETPMPIFQRMLLNATQGVGDVHDVPGPAPAVLTPSGDMPPDAQRVLPLTSGAPASQIYPGLRYPKGKQ